MTEDIEGKIQEMVRQIVEAVHPDKIILFGSHARGEAGPDSDVDLLIIAPSQVPRWQRTPPVYVLLSGMGLPQDLPWRPPEEIEDWSQVRSHLTTTAMREGRVLYETAA
jgi:UTP:GlnB (protein PII) uridylyltransferase